MAFYNNDNPVLYQIIGHCTAKYLYSLFIFILLHVEMFTKRFYTWTYWEQTKNKKMNTISQLMNLLSSHMDHYNLLKSSKGITILHNVFKNIYTVKFFS